MKLQKMILMLAILTLPSILHATPVNVLWYSGDPSDIINQHWGNSSYVDNPDALTHWQAFTVTDAEGWNIDTVFALGNNYDRPTGGWSVRTDMSRGNGGTTIASGTGDIIANNNIGTNNVIEIDIDDIFLSAGTYWLEVSTIGGGTIFGTDRSNAIGSTPNLHSIRNWPNFDQNYQPYSSYTLSSGVTGSVVPVPAAVWLFGSGLIGLVGFARR